MFIHDRKYEKLNTQLMGLSDYLFDLTLRTRSPCGTLSNVLLKVKVTKPQTLCCLL